MPLVVIIVIQNGHENFAAVTLRTLFQSASVKPPLNRMKWVYFSERPRPLNQRGDQFH